MGKDSQLRPLIHHLKIPLPMVVWVTEVVDFCRCHHLPHWVPVLVMGGSKWEQIGPPGQTKNVGWGLVLSVAYLSQWYLKTEGIP
jgi:hypothetical protein